MVSIEWLLTALEGFPSQFTALTVKFLSRAEATGTAFAERFTILFWLELVVFFLLELATLFWLPESAARGA